MNARETLLATRLWAAAGYQMERPVCSFEVGGKWCQDWDYLSDQPDQINQDELMSRDKHAILGNFCGKDHEDVWRGP